MKKLFDKLDFSDPKSAGASALLAIKTLINTFVTAKEVTGNSSLKDATRLTTVEPLTIVSKDLINEDYLHDVNSTLLNIFAGYYLQAVSILTSVQSVEVIKILDKLNPNRDASGFLATESHPSVSLENYKYELPTSKSLSLELDSEDKKQLVASSNLSVGKLLDVRIKVKDDVKGDIDVTVPISIRLLVSLLDKNSIVNIMHGGEEDKSFIERYHAWRAGRISFIKDLILCQDLIDEYKKRSIKDDTDTVDEIMRRVNNSKKYAVLTKNPSLATASNLFIISEDVAKELEYKLGSKLSKFRTRKKLFEDTYAMIIAVVDREWERVTFYVRDTEGSSDLSIKDLKNAGSNKGPDISDILKSFQLGSSPSF